MQLGNIQIENPVALGPMAGVTDWAFRTVCAELGANITVTEMVSSRALVYKDKKSDSGHSGPPFPSVCIDSAFTEELGDKTLSHLAEKG